MKQIILIGKIYSVALILFYLLSFLPDGWRTGNFFLFLFQLTIKAPLFLGLMASIIITPVGLIHYWKEIKNANMQGINIIFFSIYLFTPVLVFFYYYVNYMYTY